jgi:methylmalonyl-CoA mutase
MADQELKFAGEFPPANQSQWRHLVGAVLKGAPFEKRLISKTYDGIDIMPLYGRATEAQPIAARAPGRPWQIAQRVDHPDPAAANAMALADVGNGATGLTLVFAGSPGSYGYGIDSKPATLERVLEGIFLDGIVLDLDLAWNASDAPAHVAAIVKQRGLDPKTVDFRMSFDPLGTLATTGSGLVAWPTLAPRFTAMVGEFAAQGFRGPFAVADGRIIHAAGGSEAQELAFVLAVAVAYLRAFEGGGITLDTARKMISFQMAADADEFLTIAKFRALRKLWARVEAACSLAPQPAFIAAETAWRMMTRRDPWVNMLRTTVAAFAAGVGGANAITVLPFTTALGLPDPFARRLARNTQLILQEEAHVAVVSDAAAGSGAIEDLTLRLCEVAWTLFQEFEKAGGIVPALEQGIVQTKIAAVRAAREQAAASGRDALTGTSAFPDIHELSVDVLDIARVAPPPHGPVAVTIEALPAIRLAEPFEALRDASDRTLAKTGVRPKIFLASLGTPADFTPRATFAKNFFEAGGIEPVTNDGFADTQAMTAAFKASDATIICLCSSDKVYADAAVGAAAALKAAGTNHVYMAGRPGDHETALRAAGVQDFIYVGCDMLATLRAAHDILSIGR